VTLAPLAEHLRNTSTARHASIERALPLVSASLTHDAYRRILGALLGFYAPLEARLWQVDGLTPDLDLHSRAKTPRLRFDLRALGASEGEVTALPQCSAVPPIDSVPRALGCLYVIEGATLGGRIVSRKLAEHLSIDARTGGAFFHGYGSETGAMWRAFSARLNRQAPPFDEVLSAASETFERLEHWLFARGAPRWMKPPTPPPTIRRST
jgi:heme oxygenase